MLKRDAPTLLMVDMRDFRFNLFCRRCQGHDFFLPAHDFAAAGFAAIRSCSGKG
jgi:hypothetical protein